MDEPVFKKTYIREWRKARHLSLRKLAARLESEPGVPMLSHASLGRIENGEQPVTLSLLYALSEALDVSVPALLGMDPTKEGRVIDLMRHMTDAQRDQAIAILEALAKTG